MKIKVTIKPDSKAAKVVKKYMAEKDAFRHAVKSGEAANYIKTNKVKLDSPLSIK